MSQLLSTQTMAEPLPDLGAGTKGTAAEPHPAGRIKHGLSVQGIRMLALATWFHLVVFTVHATQLLGSPLYLINKDLYYAYMALTKQSFGLLITTVTAWFSPTVVRVSGDKSVRGQLLQTKDGRLQTDFPERLVLIANHQIYTDWLYLWWIAYTSRMHGHLYIILKESLKYIPVIGPGMMFYGFVFMARNWVKDKSRLQHRLQVLNKGSHGGPMSGSQHLDPMWLMIFPEGTNLSANTKNISAKWAQKQGIKELQHQLLPRSTGLLFCLQELKGTVDWVYDCTVAYEGIPRGAYGQDIFTLRSTYFQGRPPKSVNMYWRRFAVSSIPTDDPKQFETWLLDQWRIKDALLEQYIQNGRFPADDGHDSDGEPAINGHPGAKVLKGAGFIETEVKLAHWYEIGQIFVVLAAFALVFNIGAKLTAAYHSKQLTKSKTANRKSSTIALATIMAPYLNGHANGNRHLPTEPATESIRFSDIPSALDIQVSGADEGEAVEISLEELLDDPTELCTLLENENAEKRVWMIIALAYARQGKVDLAIDILHKGLGSLSRGSSKEKLGPLGLLCWMFLSKSRHAPRVLPEGQVPEELKTKDHWLQAATGILNDAARINPSFPPLYLARGVLYILRASLQPPSKTVAPGAVDHSERVESLRQAIKCFDEASKVSGGRNMMAILGAARAHFSLGKYAEALKEYQEVLSKMPHLQDPDPRIGVGCCFWQLGYREEAREAWERALELTPDSKIATILIGVYYLHDSANHTTKDPAFASIYKKAMTEYTQKAFKLDKDSPLTCATFGGYFLLRRTWPTVETLARRAIELTDVNAVASDGWYLLARKEHTQDVPDYFKATDYYGRADAARGGGDRGYVPARFGLAQIQVLQQDIDGAKFRLEKVVQASKSFEAMMLLGALYAEDVFTNNAVGNKEDKSAEAKKAIALLEGVRMAWKDPQKKLQPDLSVLVYLARLYEADQPEKAMQCLQQVEKQSIEDMLEQQKRPQDGEIDDATMLRLREELPPQLLNNLGCFQYQNEKYDLARDLFQTALSSLVKVGERDETIDTDALVTTISYNLARTYEAAALLDDAKQVYEGLLARHNDYTDARTRLAYIELRQNPTEDGPKAIAALSETDGADLEVRALLGWYLSRSKKRATNVAEDQEQRHYKHTLQLHEKHDRYSLTGMGNAYAIYAREMRRNTEKEKEKRSAEFVKAVGYYDKALQLDPKNAYAAQGIGIALIEDKKDLTSAVQIFSKIKDTVRDSSVFINLGHVFCELKQYSRAIENYEAALHKDRASDPQTLACLGRVWLLKGKQDKNPTAMKQSLDYSRRALAIAPSQIHFQFNIAFVQIQLAQLMYTLPESQRTLVDVQSASEGLDDAIESFTEIAQSKNPPYPKHDIEQRANMGRNTMRKQLERAIQSQREYEERNAARLQEAREIREAEMKRREEARLKAEEKAAEEKKKIAEERYKMLESSRKLAEQRAEEERRREEAEMTIDSETGERVKRKKKPRAAAGGGKRKKKGAEDSDTDSAADAERPKKPKKSKKSVTESSAVTSMDEGAKPKKKRKLTRKGIKDDKFKSSEMVVDSDEDEDVTSGPAKQNGVQNGAESPTDAQMEDADSSLPPAPDDPEDDEDDEEEEAAVARPRKKPVRRIDSDEEDNEEDDGGGAQHADNDDDDEDDDNNNEPRTTAEQAAGETKSGNVFADADVSMVDESVGAAGGANTNEYSAGDVGGDAFGTEKEAEGTGDRQ